MEVYRLPVLSDNYVFVLHNPANQVAAVVDPAIAPPVLQLLQELRADLVAIFNTHHHADHVGGNRQLMRQFPQVKVYGGAKDRGRIPGQQVFLKEGDRVEFADRVAQVFFVPGHTRAHIAYYFGPAIPLRGGAANATEPGDLFCGDTLFAGGCGRLSEGSPAQMVSSLSKLRALPDSTRVWCAHEYTLNNLRFALTVDAENRDLQARFQAVQDARNRNEATVPSLLEIEKRTNPFLRWDRPTLKATVKARDDIQTFARLRGMKDRF